MTPTEKAQLLVAEVVAALAKGTKHYNKAGKLLETPQEVLETLVIEGRIAFEPEGTIVIKFSKLRKQGRGMSPCYHVYETLSDGDTQSYGDLLRYPSKGWIFEPSVIKNQKIGDRGFPLHLDVLREIVKFSDECDSRIQENRGAK